MDTSWAESGLAAATIEYIYTSVMRAHLDKQGTHYSSTGYLTFVMVQKHNGHHFRSLKTVLAAPPCQHHVLLSLACSFLYLTNTLDISFPAVNKRLLWELHHSSSVLHRLSPLAPPSTTSNFTTTTTTINLFNIFTHYLQDITPP